MQKLISKYALAAHLAVMAVAPLFLLPFFGSSVTATVLLWLSAFGFVWVLMEPSRRRGEMPHDARMRVSRAVLSDPLFWFSLVLVAYAGVRALNVGVGMSYDAEFMVWTLQHPFFPLLPGSVSGAGYFPFAVVVALAVIFQGMRHALGRSARVAFLFVNAVGSAVAVLLLVFAISYRDATILSFMACTHLSASYFGTVFGIQLLCATVALFAVVEHRWMKAEPLAALALVGNAIGLVVFAPPLTIGAFLVAFLLLVIVSFVLARHVFEGSGSFRCALVIVIGLAAPVLYAMAATDLPGMAEKIAVVKSYNPFPDGFGALRNALSAIALKTWKSNPWIGTGLGSFPLDIRFMATGSDWTVISPSQVTALNGWWQLLSERGVIGALMIAVAVGMMLWTYFARLVRSFASVRFAPEHLLGPFVLVVLVGLSFVCCSFMRPEVLLLAGAFLSFSGGAFPARSKDGEEKEG